MTSDNVRSSQSKCSAASEFFTMSFSSASDRLSVMPAASLCRNRKRLTTLLSSPASA
jgi:hypothetical protein